MIEISRSICSNSAFKNIRIIINVYLINFKNKHIISLKYLSKYISENNNNLSGKNNPNFFKTKRDNSTLLLLKLTHC